MRNRADMILMPMGDDEAEQIFANGFEKANIGQNKFYARQIRPGKANAQINQNPFSFCFRAKAVKRGIHADFAKPTEGREHQFILT